eukprot:6139033-Prymnesium_polylepis.1
MAHDGCARQMVSSGGMLRAQEVRPAAATRTATLLPPPQLAPQLAPRLFASTSHRDPLPLALDWPP